MWPTARRRVGILLPIRHHVALGLQMWRWMEWLLVVAVLVWVWERVSRREGSASALLQGTPARVVVAIVAVAISAGAVQQVVRAGEAGSRAVWTGKYSTERLR